MFRIFYVILEIEYFFYREEYGLIHVAVLSVILLLS